MQTISYAWCILKIKYSAGCYYEERSAAQEGLASSSDLTLQCWDNLRSAVTFIFLIVKLTWIDEELEMLHEKGVSYLVTLCVSGVVQGYPELTRISRIMGCNVVGPMSVLNCQTNCDSYDLHGNTVHTPVCARPVKWFDSQRRM